MVFAARYVERNPVRAKMVRVAWRYRWSSAAVHCGAPDQSGLIDTRAWARRFAPEQWKALLREPADETQRDTLRSRTLNGRPLGSDRFIARLEAKLGVRLRANPGGRPRKKKAKSWGRGRK